MAVTCVAESDLANGTLVQALNDWTPAYPGLCLYYPRHRNLSASVRAFVEFATQGRLSNEIVSTSR
ncbi:LysR substrate-binding domain-containing protein [Pseudosulfitobacter sp. SM2401]|uniref:LysR substrate-binding domain-containing protein n=1 Tax=Pseudosulfitobacter sp. SM2401 TaxID=3350098 RepID=UPI0036F2CFB0